MGRERPMSTRASGRHGVRSPGLYPRSVRRRFESSTITRPLKRRQHRSGPSAVPPEKRPESEGLRSEPCGEATPRSKRTRPAPRSTAASLQLRRARGLGHAAHSAFEFLVQCLFAWTASRSGSLRGFESSWRGSLRSPGFAISRRTIIGTVTKMANAPTHSFH